MEEIDNIVEIAGELNKTKVIKAALQ